MLAILLINAICTQVRQWQDSSPPTPGAPAMSRATHEVSQLLVDSMVQHPAPDIRNAAYHALSSLILALRPDDQVEAVTKLLQCPIPSVAVLLLQILKAHCASQWPPSSAALAPLVAILTTQHDVRPLFDGIDESSPDAALLSEAGRCEIFTAAMTVLTFVLMKASSSQESRGEALQELLNRDVIEAYVISAGHVGNCFCDDVATVEGALLEVALAARRLHAAADFLLEQWRKVQTS